MTPMRTVSAWATAKRAARLDAAAAAAEFFRSDLREIVMGCSPWVLSGGVPALRPALFHLEYLEIALESQRDEQAAARHGCCCLQTTTSVFRRMGPRGEA